MLSGIFWGLRRPVPERVGCDSSFQTESLNHALERGVFFHEMLFS
jgi:hypothetical protein